MTGSFDAIEAEELWQLEEEVALENEFLQEAASEAQLQETEAGAVNAEDEAVTRTKASSIKAANAIVRKSNAQKKERATQATWTKMLSSEKLAASAPRLPEEALAPWIQRIHFSHSRLYERGGFGICARCAGFASHKPQSLTFECRGSVSYQEGAKSIIKKGEPLPKYKNWPCPKARKEQSLEGKAPTLRLIMRNQVATAPSVSCTSDLPRALAYMRRRRRREEEQQEAAEQREREKQKEGRQLRPKNQLQKRG